MKSSLMIFLRVDKGRCTQTLYCNMHDQWQKSVMLLPRPILTSLLILKRNTLKNMYLGTFLVVQLLRIHLPMQGTQVRALVQEDPTCRRATKHMSHNCWACTPQLLKPVCLKPVLRNRRSHCNEEPTHRNEECYISYRYLWLFRFFHNL